MNVSLGLDTSCYVTSAALVTEAGEILFNGRIPLHVDRGGFGLRQSEAFFLHIRQLPCLIQDAFDALCSSGHTLCAVGASDAPRDHEHSYMPVFIAGLCTARMLSSSQGISLHTFSHQQGHLRAAEFGCSPMPDKYLAVHLSGGTTEVLTVMRRSYTTKVLGGTSDISAGQWIDRIGVLMGCPFPAGSALEELAKGGKPALVPIGIPVKDMALSFSGAEAEVKRRLACGDEKADIALEMFQSLSRALVKALVQAHEQTGLCDALIAGGVAANGIVQKELLRQMPKRCRALRVQFAGADLAGDNAVGIALLAMEKEGAHAQ